LYFFGCTVNLFYVIFSLEGFKCPKTNCKGGLLIIVEMINKLPWHKKLKVLRVIYGWGQRQASEECLTDKKNYWLWEKGISYPRSSSRKAIARAYGLKVEHIF